MDDSEDFKKPSKPSKELDGKHDNHSGLQKVPTKTSISGVEKNGLEPKKDASIDEIDIVMSDAEKPLLDETKVDNIDNDDNKQGMILVL